MLVVPFASGFGRRLRSPVWLVLLLVALLVACSDDTSTSATDDVAPDVDAAGDVVDTGDDPVVETGSDVEDTGLDEGADVVDEEVGGNCPGSISCFDPEAERPRAQICVQAGYSQGVSCELVADGGDACCVEPFSCETNTDCELAREAEGFCVDERFDCVCNVSDGSCSSSVCSIDSECEGDDVCRGGICEPEGARTGLVARIVTPSGAIADGESRQLVAVAIDPDDPERFFTDIAIDWSSDSAAVTVSSSGLAEGSATSGSAVITAQVTDNDSDPGDTITLTNYADSDATLRIVAIDESTRGPIEGALVYVEHDGDPIEVTTNALGVAEVEDELTGQVDVTLFSDDHSYVTHVDVAGDDLQITAAPVAFAELSAPDGEGGEDRVCEGELCYDLVGVGALTGTPDFENVANSGEIEVSLSGFSLGNGLLDLNFELIVGPNVERDLSDGPIPVEGLSEIPGGVTLAFIDEPLVGDFVLTAPPGERVLWTLGGRVSLSDNPNLLLDILEQVGGNLDIAQLISIVLPLFDDFYSGVATDVLISAPDGETLNLANETAVLSIPVGRRVFIDPPTIPTTSAGPLETGVFLAGASVPGQGFLPLGITAAADGANETPVDGVLDGDPETVEIEPVGMNYAPLHGGIQGPGTQYVLVSVALPLDEAGSGGQGENSSGIITRVPSGDPLPDLVTFEQSAFPDFPEGSAYTVATRTLTIAPSEDFDADFYRVLFSGQRGRNWLVYFGSGESAVTSYAVPDPTTISEGLEDRTARLDLSVLSVALDEGNEQSPTYDGLLALGGPTLDNLVDFVAAFALLEVEPTIEEGE